ncbi:superoxide dismutase family protein [Rhodococcus spelaei]|uniref:Superoxide dismutase [Cu-Zn] n=1 Tax=Rhodococcus spelaei TaxID=2546320 RepID=A0A541BAL1_9NOCA|nr:superoxide dismutase family protein [Rhodococcus spelaei]TQF69364.1 superoxide dismutase family protein [Rhodococcus spelaei]
MALLTRRDTNTAGRVSWRVVAPMVAIAAVGLTACSNGQEPSSVPGTTPAVWTGVPAPAGAPGSGGGPGEGASAADRITSPLKDSHGDAAGTVSFVQSGDHLVVTVSAHGLTPGFHGLHVHSVGKCETNSVAPTGGAPGDFLSAGGHFQASGHTGHPSSGDLASLQVRQDGSADLMTTTDTITIEELRNNGAGTAIVVHAGADNFGNIPARYAPGGPDEETMKTGDAGARVACAVLK